jgi:hypothetical protein
MNHILSQLFDAPLLIYNVTQHNASSLMGVGCHVLFLLLLLLLFPFKVHTHPKKSFALLLSCLQLHGTNIMLPITGNKQESKMKSKLEGEHVSIQLISKKVKMLKQIYNNFCC